MKKYPDWSPYHGMANNPIIIKDKDGRDWEITVVDDNNGNKTVFIKLTAAIINSSSQSFNTADIEKAVSEQVRSTYNFGESSWNNGTPTSFNVVTTVEVRSITKESDLKNNEHLIKILDDSDPMVDGLYGRVDKIGGTKLFLNANKVANMLNGKDNNTIPHELGHTLGLLHPDDFITQLQGILPWNNQQNYDDQKQQENKENAMYSGGSGLLKDKTSTQVTKEQIETAVEEYNEGDLNKK